MDDRKSGFPFEVDTESTVPLWVQLRKRIVYLINSGYFKPGDQLPKIRELAVEISINFNTVNKAYLSLQSDGYLKSVRGKGVFVSKSAPLQGRSASDAVEAVLDDCLHTCRTLGLSYDDTVSQLASRAAYLKMAEAAPERVSGSNVIVLMPEDSASKKEA